ncbi:hypothetical protein SAMN05444410_11455 [Hydrobacter penzbergensis]|uniref:Uncharacterized protein n=1 Tax=Hydrobacter penzbergensis TaxID=1235997 RepID=A0A8X8LCC2_9BACT|nr:hypothetical protein CLV53_11079 [Sediminibacterium magnilacihabitans]SDX36777.1 hypothetical protein SAMN05444410_11455 [Hydrobacter penzbergensis]
MGGFKLSTSLKILSKGLRTQIRINKKNVVIGKRETDVVESY